MAEGMKGKLPPLNLIDIFEDRFGKDSMVAPLSDRKRGRPVEEFLDNWELDRLEKILEFPLQGISRSKSLEILYEELGKHSERHVEFIFLKKIHHKLESAKKKE